MTHSEIKPMVKGDSNDKYTFSVLFGMHQKYIYNLFYQLTGNPADADDLTQETFIKIYKKLHTFRAESNIRTWIYRIALNVFHSDKRAKPPHASICIGKIKIPCSDGNPERIIIKREMQWCIIHVLQQHLPQHYREVLVLRNLQNLSYDEISHILSIPVGTVKVRLHRARKRFRDHFVQGGCKALVEEYLCICDGVEHL